jgi:hypothetical protein
MRRKDMQLCKSQWKGLATEKSKQKAKLQEGRWGGMTNHHKALQRYVFRMVAFLIDLPIKW